MGLFKNILKAAAPFALAAAPFTGGLTLGAASVLGPAAVAGEVAGGVAASTTLTGVGTVGNMLSSSDAAKEKEKQVINKKLLTPTAPANSGVPTLGTYASGGYRDPFTILPSPYGEENPKPGVPSFQTPGVLQPTEPFEVVGQKTRETLATGAAGEDVQFGGINPQSAGLGVGSGVMDTLDGTELMTEKFKKYQAIMGLAKGVDVQTTDDTSNLNTAFPKGDFDILGMRNLGDVAFTVASLVGAVQDAKRAAHGKGPGALSRFTGALNTGIRQPMMERETTISKARLEAIQKQKDKEFEIEKIRYQDELKQDDPNDFTLAPGSVRYDKTGKVIARGPSERAGTPGGTSGPNEKTVRVYPKGKGLTGKGTTLEITQTESELLTAARLNKNHPNSKKVFEDLKAKYGTTFK